MLGGRCRTLLPTLLLAAFPGRTQGISDRLISLSGSIFNFFFPLSFPWAWRGDSEFTLGVGRVTGFAIINLLFSQPPGMNDFEICKPDCQHLQRRKQPESREKRFISFRLGGSANFPGAKRRGVKRTGL